MILRANTLQRYGCTRLTESSILVSTADATGSAVSSKMIANPTFPLWNAADTDMLYESPAILNRGAWRYGARHATEDDDIAGGKMQPRMKEKLLVAAAKELRAIRRELTLRHVIWGTFRHRDERVIRMPHWGLRKRQSFHDGLCVAELLVAIGQSLNEAETPLGTHPVGRHWLWHSHCYRRRQCPDHTAVDEPEGARYAATPRHAGTLGP